MTLQQVIREMEREVEQEAIVQSCVVDRWLSALKTEGAKPEKLLTFKEVCACVANDTPMQYRTTGIFQSVAAGAWGDWSMTRSNSIDMFAYDYRLRPGLAPEEISNMMAGAELAAKEEDKRNDDVWHVPERREMR